MTSLLEKMVAILAPHHCIICGKEDNIICENCLFSEQKMLSPTCCLCATPNADWRVCDKCRVQVTLGYIWPASEYSGAVKQLVHLLKYERAKAAHQPLAALIEDAMPFGEWLIVPVPTEPKRIRQRGYDHAQLIARHVAQLRHLPYYQVLLRVQHARQVGENRVQRLVQAAGMFAVSPRVNVKGAKIVLIDDVCTTGATLTAAAKALHDAGAAEIHACVAAWQPPRR